MHCAIYEGCYSRKLIQNAIGHDFTRSLINLKQEQDWPTLENVISKITTPSVLFIDSLVHVILKYGIRDTYQLLHKIINNKTSKYYTLIIPGNNSILVLQLVAVYHTDVIDDAKILSYFQHLSTFSISLEPKFHSTRPRLAYLYKKSGGKVVKQIEEYYFENGMLKTEAVQKLDPQKLIQESIEEIEPDKLTTFKISLKDNEKKAKESVTLPYLPKYVAYFLILCNLLFMLNFREKSDEGGGQIFYQFDDIDDWDEEDPDDDLNI